MMLFTDFVEVFFSPADLNRRWQTWGWWRGLPPNRPHKTLMGFDFFKDGQEELPNNYTS
jgi:hypothetical protein